jgi:hypothetical protein
MVAKTLQYFYKLHEVVQASRGTVYNVHEANLHYYQQCCGSGSESGSTGSTCFWASWICIRIH